MLSTKDRDGLRNFTGLVRRVIRRADATAGKGMATPPTSRARRSPPAWPADAADSIGPRSRISHLGFDPPPRILITGSLYLAGEVLAANSAEPV